MIKSASVLTFEVGNTLFRQGSIYFDSKFNILVVRSLLFSRRWHYSTHFWFLLEDRGSLFTEVGSGRQRKRTGRCSRVGGGVYLVLGTLCPQPGRGILKLARGMKGGPRSPWTGTLGQTVGDTSLKFSAYFPSPTHCSLSSETAVGPSSYKTCIGQTPTHLHPPPPLSDKVTLAPCPPATAFVTSHSPATPLCLPPL